MLVRKAGIAGQLRTWCPITVLAVVVLVQTVARTGEFGGFVDSTKPARGAQMFTTADGYVLFWNGTPVNGDAASFLALTEFLQGQRLPAGTGIYDARAGYAYLAALVSPLMGHYQAFVAINAAAWLGAALCMYWLAGRLLHSHLAAWLAGVLTATGQGFSFMVGTPVSTAAAFASVAVVLAFAEWLGLFQPRSRLRDWAHAGWLLAATSLLYPIHLVLLAFVWLYGLGRARILGMLLLTGVALGLASVWPLIGAHLVGLDFDPLNSEQLGDALNRWWTVLHQRPSVIVDKLRHSPIAGTIYAAFPGPLLPVAILGYLTTKPEVRWWAVALGSAVVWASLIFTALFALPRSAYFAYPAVYLLAAAGLTVLASLPRRWRGWQRSVAPRLRPIASAAVVVIGLLLIVSPSQAAFRGNAYYDFIFHFWTPSWQQPAREP